MRGEDRLILTISVCPSGSPPHARGRLAACLTQNEPDGLTPACAGKTAEFWFAAIKVAGSPPHARGRLVNIPGIGVGFRLTPACAGKTVRFPRESDKVVLQFTNFS